MNEPKIRFKGFEGEWKSETLSNLSYSICSGRDVAHEGSYPLYGSTGIIGTTDKPSHNGRMLLVARVGANAGKLQLINVECGISDNTLIIKPKEIISDSYLYHYFMHFDLNRFIYGSGQPLITGGMLKTMFVHFGDKVEREKIGKYFSTLDSLISSASSRLGALKQVKEASLQAMFPQEGETVPKIRFKGFDGDWKKVRLEDIAIINPKCELPDSFEYVDLESVVGTIMTSHRREIKASAPSRAQRLAEKGDIFYQTVRPYQKNNYHYQMDNKDFVFSTGYAQIRALKDGLFLFTVIQSNQFMKQVMDNCTGTSFPAINPSSLRKLWVYDCDMQEQQVIGKYFSALDRKIELQSQRLEKLKQIKAACLDKMFV